MKQTLSLLAVLLSAGLLSAQTVTPGGNGIGFANPLTAADQLIGSGDSSAGTATSNVVRRPIMKNRRRPFFRNRFGEICYLRDVRQLRAGAQFLEGWVTKFARGHADLFLALRLGHVGLIDLERRCTNLLSAGKEIVCTHRLTLTYSSSVTTAILQS